MALAPVTSLHYTTDKTVKFASKNLNLITKAADLAHLYSVLEPGVPSTITKIFCGVIPEFCNDLQLLVSSHDPNLDDLDRF